MKWKQYHEIFVEQFDTHKRQEEHAGLAREKLIKLDTAALATKYFVISKGEEKLGQKSSFKSSN